MSKIQKYDACDCGYNSCHEPIRKDDGGYIKVSDLRERLEVDKKELEAMLTKLPLANLDSIKEGELIGKISYIDVLLAALDGKEGE